MTFNVFFLSVTSTVNLQFVGVREKYSKNRINDLIKQLDSTLCLAEPEGRYNSLSNNLKNLVSISLADSTWSKYCSGWRAWNDYSLYVDEQVNLPLKIETFRSFATYCTTVRKVSVQTTKSYMYSMELAHVLKNLQCPNYNADKLIAIILNGAKNWKELEQPVSNFRRVMTISTLLLIGHRLANTSWCEVSKQVIWSVCTLAFFTSLRLGEILSSLVNSFDANSTLLWKHVKFLNCNEILLFVPSTKTSKCRGEFIDVFPIAPHPCCPVSALKKLMEVQLTENLFSLESPVFRFKSGKNLTVKKLNETLKDLLSDIYVPGENSITAHSFRAALPAEMDKYPEMFSKNDIQQWGRWLGHSYLLYLRLHRENRRKFFNKIISVIM
jgi:hypothetical protein